MPFSRDQADEFFSKLMSDAQPNRIDTPDAANTIFADMGVRGRELEAAKDRKADAVERANRLKRERQYDGPGADLWASFGTGSNMLLEGIGTLYGLAPGTSMDNAMRLQGASGVEHFEDQKSLSLRNRQNQRSRAVDDAETMAGQFGTAIWETFKNPALLSSLVAEQFPMLTPIGVAGRGGRVAATKARLSARGVDIAGTGAAVATGASLQGSQIASQTYNDLLALPEQIWSQNPDYLEEAARVGPQQARENISLNLARAAGAASFGLSAVTNALPGGVIVERALAGSTKKLQGNFATRGVKGFLGEGLQETIEEGGGEFFGNVAKRTIDPSQELSAGVGEAAGLGAVGGASIGGPLGMMSRAKRTPGEKDADIGKTTPTQLTAYAAARETGNIDALVTRDKKNNETFNPGLAAMALLGRAADVELSPEERAESRGQLDQLIGELEGEVAAREAAVEDLSDAQIAEDAAAIKDFEAARDALPQDAPNRVDLQAGIDALLDKKKTRKQELVKATERADREQGFLVSARAARDGLAAETVVQEGGLEPLLEAVDAKEASPARTEAAGLFIQLLMEAPDAVDDATVARLADNEAGSFTLEQVNTLRVFSEARTARNEAQTRDGVTDDILNGGPGHKGMAQYLRDMGHAIKSGKVEHAAQELAGIGNFMASHARKAAVLRKIAAEVERTGERRYLVYDKAVEGGWKMSVRRPSEWVTEHDRRRNGGLIAHKSPEGIATTYDNAAILQQEVGAIEATQAQMQHSYDLAFGEFAITPSQQAIAPTAETVPQVSPTPTTPPIAPQAEPTAAVAEAAPAQAEPTPEPTPASREDGPQAQPAAEAVATEPTPEPVQETSPEPTAEVVEETAPEVVQEAPQEAGPIDDVEAQLKNLEESSKKDPESDIEIETEPSDMIPATKEEAFVGPMIPLEVGPKGAKRYALRNLIAAYVTQAGAKGSLDTMQRPLVAMKDFISTWVKPENRALARHFVDVGKEGFTDLQSAYLRMFGTRTQQWNARLRELISTEGRKPAFRHRDYIQFWGDGPIPENLLTAISSSAFQYIAANGRQAGYNNFDAINKILGRKTDHPVTPEEVALLGQAGTRKTLVVQELGQAAFEAAGFKVSAEAPVNVESQLKVALGGYALALLLSENLLENNPLHSAILTESASRAAARLRDDTGMLNEQGDADVTPPAASRKKSPLVQTFIRTKFDARQSGYPRVAHPHVLTIADAAQGTENILSRLLGNEALEVHPTFKREEFTQTTTRRTDREVPAVQAKGLGKAMKYAWKLRANMHRARSALSRDLMLRIEGVVDLDQRYVHEDNRVKAESANHNITLAHDRVDALIKNMEAQPDGLASLFYLAMVVWKQQRVGYLSNQINPQGNKQQRSYVGMKSWEVTFDAKDATSTMLRNFKLAVAQGMGLKVDKQNLAESVAQLDTLIENPTVRAGIEALKNIKEGELLSETDQAAVEAAVTLGDEKTHSLDALVNWANFELARDGEADNQFTTDMQFEVDGVTNGPAFAHALLGVLSASLGERMGFYTKDSGHTGHAKWKEAGPAHQDLYEHLMQILQSHLSRDAVTDARMDAISHFTGELVDDQGRPTAKGRKVVKLPTTSMVFGSVTKNSLADMSAEFLEMFTDRLEQNANEVGDGVTDRSRLLQMRLSVKKWNTLLPHNQQLPLPTTLEQGMQLSMSKRQQNSVQRAFTESLGQATETALNQVFAEFIEARNQVNMASRVTWQLHHEAREFLLERKRAQRIAEKKIETDKEGNPIHDLTREDIAEVDAELKDLLPVVHTPMSKESGNLNAGIDMSKKKTRLTDPDNTPYTQEFKLGRRIPASAKSTAAFLRARGTQFEFVDPGVATVIGITHAADSAVAIKAYSEIPALNNHDGLGVGIDRIFDMAAALNKATYQTLTGYSMGLEVFDSLQRVMLGYARLMQNPEYKAPLNQRLDAVKAQMKKTEMTTLRDYVQQFEAQMLYAERAKLEYFLTVAVVDQYAMDEGSYQVTAKDLADTQALLDTVNDRIAAMTESQKALFPEPSRKAPPEQSQVLEPRDDVADPQAVTRPYPEDTPWGRVGDPQVASDADLVAFLQANPNTTVAQLIPVLRASIQKTSATKEVMQFRLGLLRQISKIADLKTPIQYITPDTPSTRKKTGLRTTRGWYTLDRKGARIGIKSPDFVHSGVTAELLLHELTHAALAQTIEATDSKFAPEVNFPRNPENLQGVEAAIRDLRTLRELAEQYVTDHNLTQFKPAIKDVHELVAWGMTNPEFQMQVLTRVNMPSKVGGNTLYSGMKAFIQGMVRIFYRHARSDVTAQQKAENGMALMIANTGLLFGEATNTQAEQTAITLRQESVAPRAFTTAEVFTALGNIPGQKKTDSFFIRHLQRVLTTTVQAAYGPFGSLKAPAARRAAVNAQDTFINALVHGEAPFASKAQPILKMTDQEAFVLDSVEVTVGEALHRFPTIRKELQRLFNEAKAQLKIEDFHDGVWADATQQQQADAKAIHDLLFTLEQKGDGTSDFLSRFVAIGLAHQQTNTALQGLAPRVDDRRMAGKTFGERLVLFFNRIMEIFQLHVTGTTFGQKADQRLLTLAQRLALVEEKRKTKLARVENALEGTFEDSINHLNDVAKNQLIKISETKFFSESKSGLLRASAKVTNVTAKGYGAGIFDGLILMRDKVSKERQSTLASIIAEVKGPEAQAQALLRIQKSHEIHRQHVKTEMAELVRESFERDLTEQESHALTALMRVDLAGLTGHPKSPTSLVDVANMLGDPAALDSAIQALEAQLTGAHKQYHINKSEELGLHMARGTVVRDNLQMNAHNIASLFGTARQISQADAARALPVIDQLASLYGMRFLGREQKTLVRNVILEEAARKKGNGVQTVVDLHRQMQKQALIERFENDPTQVMKGYTRDSLSPYVTVIVAGPTKGAELIAQGFAQGKQVEPDPTDPDQAVRHMYTVTEGGTPNRVTGFMPTTGERARGKQVHFGLTRVDRQGVNTFNKAINDKINQDKAATIDAQFNARPRINPDSRKESANRMVPVMNRRGEVVNHRYMMENSTKDGVMRRENSVDQVMGALAASIFDKGGVEQLGLNAVQAIKDQYLEDGKNNPLAYLEVSENSPDPEIRETYRLLPEATKAAIVKVWGRPAMKVRKDHMDITFGYRKRTLAEPFSKNPNELSDLQRVFIGLVEHFPDPVNPGKLMGKKAALRVTQFESIWQFLVTEVKDAVVIKNVTTWLANESSNLTVLAWWGVPISDIVKYHAKGLQGYLDYSRDLKEHTKLSALLEIEYVTDEANKMHQRLIELEDNMARNPVIKMIEAGMSQTIIQDVDSTADPHGYKSRLTRTLEKQTAKLPKALVDTGKFMYMTHDTTLYKAMHSATFLSDFLGRYTLYEHLTTRKDPKTHEEAIQAASDSFVNYDLPTDRNIQYLNDMGIIFFTKYYLRIQRVLVHMYKESPARTLGMFLFTQNFSFPTVMETGWWEKLENPLSTGALMLPEAALEPAPIKGLLHVRG